MPRRKLFGGLTGTHQTARRAGVHEEVAAKIQRLIQQKLNPRVHSHPARRVVSNGGSGFPSDESEQLSKNYVVSATIFARPSPLIFSDLSAIDSGGFFAQGGKANRQAAHTSATISDSVPSIWSRCPSSIIASKRRTGRSSSGIINPRSSRKVSRQRSMNRALS